MNTFLFAWATILRSPAVQRESIRSAIIALQRGAVGRKAYVSSVTKLRCLMSLIIPTVRSRSDRHREIRRGDVCHAEAVIAMSNFLVVTWDYTVRWTRPKQKALESQLLEICRAELRRRSEINRLAVYTRSGLAEFAARSQAAHTCAVEHG